MQRNKGIHRNNITFTVSNKLCTGCGVCEDMCPKHCIKIKVQDGKYRPTVDNQECLSDKCGRCLKVCPGISTNLIESAEVNFTDKTVKSDRYIGKYVGLHTGYALDEDIRLHSASGGLVSQFLIFLLAKKIIDGAVVTGYGEDHITPFSYIARTKEGVLKARSSKYCPVALNKVGNEICASEGKYVIVGLPCHIQGFRKRAKIDRKFRERVIGMFSVYCSSGRTFNGRDYIFEHYGVRKDKIEYFAFRDNGCLGNLTVKEKKKPAAGEKFRLVATHSSDCTELQIPFSHYYGPMLRSFFKPHRCLTCIDHYGELADVCFGDIHITPYDKDTIGISSWITRSEYWENLFADAAKEGYIRMDDVDAKTLNDSQAAMLYPKRRRAAAVMAMDKIMGRQPPRYDKTLEQPTFKDYIAEIICHAQRFVGKRKYLWWIIELINKGK